jgi:hypothetical protein
VFALTRNDVLRSNANPLACEDGRLGYRIDGSGQTNGTVDAIEAVFVVGVYAIEKMGWALVVVDENGQP